MNLILPGRNFKEETSIFKRVAKGIKPDCYLHVLCKSIALSDSFSDPLSRFSTKALNLAAGLILSDLFSDQMLTDKNIITALTNNTGLCHEIRCTL